VEDIPTYMLLTCMHVYVVDMFCLYINCSSVLLYLTAILIKSIIKNCL